MCKWILLLSICVASLWITVVEAGAPLHIGDRRQVFIDGCLIEESRGIELLVHRPQKTGEIVIKCEYPWEERFGQYHSVLKDGNIYHMWYTVYGKADSNAVPVRSIVRRGGPDQKDTSCQLTIPILLGLVGEVEWEAENKCCSYEANLVF